MSNKSHPRTIHLKLPPSVVVMLFAALEVMADTGSDDRTSETDGMVNGGAKVSSNNYVACYDNRNKDPTCIRKRAIIAGAIIGSVFALLGVILLYMTCSERWKKRKSRSPLEESEPLRDGAGRVTDHEKVVAQGNKGEADDFYLHPDGSDETLVARTNSTVSKYAPSKL